jgi:hypothetical protein
MRPEDNKQESGLSPALNTKPVLSPFVNLGKKSQGLLMIESISAMKDRRLGKLEG